MKRIGLFGGSFNPIHNGHIALAKTLLRQCALDEVWLMVSPQNPLKRHSSDLLDDNLRYKMAEIALEGVEGVKACDYELKLPKPSYTWNTLQHLHEDYPDDEFVMLIGGDNWALFPKWYRAEVILRNHRVVVYPRRGSEIDQSVLPANVTVVDTELLDISSTMIRERVSKGKSITGYVPSVIEPLVQDYYCGCGKETP